MEELFCKYCAYYISGNNNEEELNHLNKEAQDKAKEYQKKTSKFVKNLRHKANKLGYGIDFESFCTLLEEYIAKKSELEDKEKRCYLKVLFSMSKIYDVNLREELEKYVSYKKVTNRQITERDVFISFCKYNLNPNDDISEFNRLTSICNANHLNFDEIHEHSLIFVEEIKLLTEKLGFTSSLEDVYKMIAKYQKDKSTMSDSEKTSYLKLLLYLCEMYNINLREQITKEPVKENNSSIHKLSNNPLKNDELIANLLKERYENGYFRIEDFIYNCNIIKEQEYDYNQEIANLAFTIYQQFLAKFTNYAYDDLNPLYSNMITEEDMLRLEELTEEDFLHILNEINKHESTHYICKKYKLPESLYKFINKSIFETIDLKTKSIGINSHSLFNLPSTKNSISIYLNGPDITIIELLKKYIKKCIDNNMNYELDGLCFNNNTFKTIIYSNKENFKDKISIIESIIQENPNISENLTITFPFSCHKKDKIYSMSRRYIVASDEHISYIDYTNALLEISYYRIIAKIAIAKIKDKKDASIVDNFINLNNLTCPHLNPLDSSFNDIPFTTIKDIINNYIAEITNTLHKYIIDSAYQESITEEFTKAILYISNLIEQKDKRQIRNITIE